MKKFLILVAIILTSCSLSNEEKAEKLISETLKNNLYYPDSYEPVSTIVDSMFIDITIIEPILEISEEIEKLISKINGCERKIESSETSMDLWAPDGYSSRFSRGEYARAKKEKEEAKSDMEKHSKKLLEHLASLKDNVTKFKKGEFTGWIVAHKFKSLNGIGSMSVPNEMIFFCNKEFTTCCGYKVNKIERLTNVLEIVNKATSDEEIMDFFKENQFPFLY